MKFSFIDIYNITPYWPEQLQNTHVMAAMWFDNMNILKLLLSKQMQKI